MESPLFSRFIGSAPGFEKSKAFSKQAEARVITKGRAEGHSEAFTPDGRPCFPEIRNGKIVAWRPL